MKNTKPLTDVVTPSKDSPVLLPAALQWLTQHRIVWICLLWLLSRGALLFLVAPNPDAKRYFDTSGAFLKGMIPYLQKMRERGSLKLPS